MDTWNKLFALIIIAVGIAFLPLGCGARDFAPPGFAPLPDDGGEISCRYNVERTSCVPTPSCRVETYECPFCADGQPSTNEVVRECTLVALFDNTLCTPNCGQE